VERLSETAVEEDNGDEEEDAEDAEEDGNSDDDDDDDDDDEDLEADEEAFAWEAAFRVLAISLQTQYRCSASAKL
jgi:hypothetical protein